MVNNQLFDFEARDKEGNTPLHEALEGSRVDIAYELLSYRKGLIFADFFTFFVMLEFFS